MILESRIDSIRTVLTLCTSVAQDTNSLVESTCVGYACYGALSTRILASVTMMNMHSLVYRIR